MEADRFSTLHPAVNFIYFAFVIVFSMIFMNPIMLAISLTGAVSYSIYLNGKRAVKFNLLFLLPMMFLTAVLNPMFNHAGVTILFYSFTDNPITLESILYGIAAAFMLAGVICWFSCYNRIMTSDKFIYLFGRIIPSLSLILSMVLRFVPRYKEQIKRISQAQKGLLGNESENLAGKIRRGTRILSIMTTWALENAIETADSMRSRGYGLPGRSAFSMFTFGRRDGVLLGGILLASVLVSIAAGLGIVSIRYFPSVKMAPIEPASILFYAVYGVYCFLPILFNIREDLRWKRIQSAA